MIDSISKIMISSQRLRLSFKLGTTLTMALVAASGIGAQVPVDPIDFRPPFLACALFCPTTGGNLVTNPGFEQGDTGFTSQAAPDTVPPPLMAGEYTIVQNAVQANPRWTGTALAGNNFLVVDSIDHNVSGNTLVWSQSSIAVAANTLYSFNISASNVNNNGDDPPTIRLRIRQNGNVVQTSPPVTLNWGPGVWTPVCLGWSSPSNNPVTLDIVAINTRFLGHDVGIDNIRFSGCCGFANSGFHLVRGTCPGDPVTATAFQTVRGVNHQWSLCESDAAGTRCVDETIRCWGPTCAFGDLEGGKCYRVKHGIWSGCFDWTETREVFCVPRAHFLSDSCIDPEICERLQCNDGETFFSNDCGCGCIESKPPGAVDLRINKRLSRVRTEGTLQWIFTLTVRNVGTTPTSETIVVSDSLPTGLNFVSATGSPWSCSNQDRDVTCLHPENPVLGPGETTTIELTVALERAAFEGVRNCARVDTPNDIRALNNRSCVSMPCPNPDDPGVHYLPGSDRDQRICQRAAASTPPPCSGNQSWFWGACGCGCIESPPPIDPSAESADSE